MREHNTGYFDYARHMSLQHQQYFLNLPYDAAQFREFSATVQQSLVEQQAVEAVDEVSFDEFLRDYFAQTL